MTFPYDEVFEKAERTLLDYGSRRVPLAQLRERLDAFKTYADRRLTDDQYYDVLVAVVFYSGFKAATVAAKMPIIRKHFPGYKTVASYTSTDTAHILADPEMIKHRKKIEACVKNAREFEARIRQHGSFCNYIDSFKPKESIGNLVRLQQDLQRRFAFLGGITVFHFMTDLGFPVLKPDRVVSRVFYRLGITTSETDVSETINQGTRFAESTGFPIRYIDIVFVAYGQAQYPELGIDRGICLNDPRCSVCGLRDHCKYFQQKLERVR